MADDFVRVRLVKISGQDLHLFDFDYDLTWMAFFLNAEGKVLGRYGGRDATGPDSRNSLAGLRYAMQAALETHRRDPNARPAPRPARPLLAEEYPAAKRLIRGECIHCHQVHEFRRELAQSTGTWRREDLWLYPLPENVGLTLEKDCGDRIQAVLAGSAAARAGLQAGDILQSINNVPVASFADVQYGLNRAPWKGSIPVAWQRSGQSMNATLELADGWKKTNLTWRPSMLDILPSLSVFGRDLTGEEKRKLGLSEERLAFEQESPVYATLQAVGLRAGDVIIGIDDQALAMTMKEFLGHIRRNYLVGDRITLNILRDGKRVDLPLTLK